MQHVSTALLMRLGRALLPAAHSRRRTDSKPALMRHFWGLGGAAAMLACHGAGAHLLADRSTVSPSAGQATCPSSPLAHGMLQRPLVPGSPGPIGYAHSVAATSQSFEQSCNESACAIHRRCTAVLPEYPPLAEKSNQ